MAASFARGGHFLVTGNSGSGRVAPSPRFVPDQNCSSDKASAPAAPLTTLYASAWACGRM